MKITAVLITILFVPIGSVKCTFYITFTLTGIYNKSTSGNLLLSYIPYTNKIRKIRIEGQSLI